MPGNSVRFQWDKTTEIISSWALLSARWPAKHLFAASHIRWVFFSVLPITAFLSTRALPFKARSYLNPMVISVSYGCHSYQDGISFVYSLQLHINLKSVSRTL